jgi:hypothetical protein
MTTPIAVRANLGDGLAVSRIGYGAMQLPLSDGNYLTILNIEPEH